MNTPESSNSSRLLAYGTVACGATAMLAGNAEAATIVNVNSSTYATGLSDLGTFQTTTTLKGYLRVIGSTGVSSPSADGVFVQRAASATNVTFSGSTTSGFAIGYGSSGWNGVQMNSSDNWFYAVASSNPSQRMWLQLQFGGSMTSGFTIVKAVIPDVVGELPSASHAANAVPETSSLALLSLGAAGLLKRRRRAA